MRCIFATAMCVNHLQCHAHGVLSEYSSLLWVGVSISDIFLVSYDQWRNYWGGGGGGGGPGGP